eukprot:CAMPEP_0177702126 /NCGR_PEP_ID=MMETSP0484_2-20121128/6975_1 /TAXON_ID=354590 /ORGANISM="Rhodomonas lens, Strain RHODO" /LENGTH=144 /DNA_ID=CAMNT_0019213399 /DNA_START=217 /DNA_END=651 /DNA_ORIENTATION=-
MGFEGWRSSGAIGTSSSLSTCPRRGKESPSPCGGSSEGRNQKMKFLGLSPVDKTRAKLAMTPMSHWLTHLVPRFLASCLNMWLLYHSMVVCAVAIRYVCHDSSSPTAIETEKARMNEKTTAPFSLCPRFLCKFERKAGPMVHMT